MNKQDNVFVGKLHKDPELEHARDTLKPYVLLSFPTDGLYDKDKDERETVWIDFYLSGEMAERVSKHLRKGNVVRIEYILLPVKIEMEGGKKKFYRPFVTNIDYISWDSSNAH